MRGGVPICWPIFGPAPNDSPLFSKLKQHGFARTSVWEFVGAQDEGEGIKATFSAASPPPSRSLDSPH